MRKDKKHKEGEESRFDLQSIQQYIREAFLELTSSSLGDNLSEEEYNRRKARRDELRSSLRSCMHGDLSGKKYVKLYMRDILQKTYGLNENNIDYVIPFERVDRLTPQDMFEILLYKYQLTHKYDALHEMIQTYRWDELKPYEDGTEGFIITADDIREAFIREKPILTLTDKINIIVQRVFQQYKGLGIIDEIRDQNIDGVNGGTSGVPSGVAIELDLTQFSKERKEIPRSYDAVWLFYKGKTIHLSFLSFGSEHELKRVCQNIYTFENPGELTEQKGFIINDMADGSRVVVVRPKMAESWAFFVRKFDLRIVQVEELIKDENAELIIGMLIHLMKGQRFTAFTGDQGSGKTTMLKALIKYISRTLSIRAQEESMFELMLRKLFWDRNILTFRSTAKVSAQEGLSVFKKTDASLTIAGEAATHAMASAVVRIVQELTSFSLVTHHAPTFEDLISSFKNSLVVSGYITDGYTALKEVVNAIKFDVHHVKNAATGHRYIERITECIPLKETSEYPDEYKYHDDMNLKAAAFMDTQKEFYERSTDRKAYTYQNIIEWRDGRYVAVNRPTEQNVQEMIRHMNPNDAEAFKTFLNTHWGPASNDDPNRSLVLRHGRTFAITDRQPVS